MAQITEEYLNQLQEIEPVTLAAVSAIFTVFNVSVSIYKKHLTKAARRCQNLPQKEKAICMLMAKAQAKQVQLSVLKKGIQKCAKTKDPAKCKQKFIEKMNKVGGEQKFLKVRMQQLAKQKYAR